MRDLVTKRIRDILDPRDVGRYLPVLELMYKLWHDQPMDRSIARGKKSALMEWIKLVPHDVDFSVLSDEELLAVYELTMRRFSVQR